MRVLLLPALVTALLAANPVHAEEPMTRAEALELCKRVAEIAEAVMESRQAGVPMVKLMETVPDNSVYQSIIIDAYQKMRIPPDFPDMQRSAITDFQDQQYGECLRQLLPK
ncbi:hypothetical protein [Pseudazoarcus pumilus]|uniref:Uncharacterized protein n=1 Tax=Pseudazoarcus pumilus TaxID=2067960 RepID=A0A2I6S9F3_9RHOO|nr:hypothetical protein [Pseudazoarcus pumilus]AUN95893.1 hypothetical protein C0099_13705 [Pseudazoarcus pumilus]